MRVPAAYRSRTPSHRRGGGRSDAATPWVAAGADDCRSASGIEPQALDRLSLIIVTLIIAVGAFDLACTLTAFEQGSLVELNPIARSVLAHGGGPALAVYRFIMTTIACVAWSWGLKAYGIRHRTAVHGRRVRTVIVAAAAFLVIAHTGLVGWWLVWLAA